MMDCENGKIYSEKEIEVVRKLFKNHEFKQIEPTETQMKRRPPRVGRNDTCPCGSEKKFKRCCYTGNSRPVLKEGE